MVKVLKILSNFHKSPLSQDIKQQQVLLIFCKITFVYIYRMKMTPRYSFLNMAYARIERKRYTISHANNDNLQKSIQ